MGLSKEEKEQLDALTKKSKEPDTPKPSMSFSLDLGSDVAWERAKKLGLIGGDDDDGDDGEDDDDNREEAPKQRGYFG